ncbi:SulP family inorganic anion transporter [Schinkia azotoformans]|uniref:SulP family inorganic anion transporter n=1 Tax=Schinkia azotoformans TaxID=1454 RepID=UPI002DB60192|nr:SulP family inorganic anion transporter [Schinkia azotoformans]MEC1718521.1 SulP family inorganic anion transporter [Schinkia azotoformans]MEC1742146.1 SulP family inorganic anion transporter [Schinkia azotoformans]MEC1747396.1 SulP family inorganic anion transporter [Schinkia azotoformans]MEC1760479.1 SulP family inorganic anion transporter [Schinkia azotoformans]MEC1768565.1 SulP family inorganic anion transporter [Schinkia azotoformans]
MFESFKREFLAGITVAVVALPLALAFGMQATGNSEGAIIGLYGAIITGFFAAMFGGTPRQVTGPTGPITIIVTGIVAQYGLTYAFIAAFMGGLFQIVFGILKLGNYLKFIPLPVVSGFMNGIAIIIIIGQLKYVTSGFLIVLLTIVFMLISIKWIKMIPPSLMALIIGTIAVIGLERIMPIVHFSLPFINEFSLFGEVERIGEIPKGLPQLHLPIVEMDILIQLIPPAISIAILGSIDSLLTSVVMDNLTGTKHNSNKELIGQGIGNAMAGLFGAMPGAGATVRSVVNLRSGAQTGLSAMIHSVALLSFMLVLGSLASQIPLAVLAGILIVTGFTMFDVDSLRVVRSEPRSDAIVMILTMVLTVVVDLMVAVGIGIVFSALIFMKRMSEEGVKMTNRMEGEMSIYTLDGPLYFGSTDALIDTIMKDKEKSIVIEMDRVPVIDATGALALVQIYDQLKERGQNLYLIGVQKNVKVRLRKMKIFESLGNKPRFKDIEDLKYYAVHGYRKKVEKVLNH